MNDFQDIFKAATSGINSNYFKTEIIIANSKSKIVYRERIYCYELYHQMRNNWPQDGTLILFGEYDKNGSQFFARTSVRGAKPDFSIHTPGKSDANLLAIEVKPVTARLKYIQSDLKKLHGFLKEANFSFGIFLIYGKGAKTKAIYIKNNRKNWGIDLNIEIWAHENENEEAILT